MAELEDTVISRSDGEPRDEAYCSACNRSYPPHYENCPQDGAKLIRLAAQRDAMVGRMLENRYEVLGRLGEGGMGAVYRGRQLSVDREVAIKVIDIAVSRDRTAVKRFLREARLSSRLVHPQIVHMFDFGQTEDGILYLVMELLRGKTLSSEIGGRALAPSRAVGFALQLCDALEQAHGQGIIHRDLKPSNVVVLDALPGAPADRIKVLDFGLAKSLVSESMSSVTKTNAMMGTPLYMSPEQIEGQPSDQRSDFYSLGCMLYEMLAGQPPFIDDTINGVLHKQLREAPPPLPTEIPAHIRATVSRLLEKKPSRRFEEVRDVRDALRGKAMAALDVTIKPSPSTTSAETVDVRRPRSKLPLVLGGLIAVAAAVVITIVVMGRGDRGVAPPASDAGRAGVAPLADAAVVDAPLADAAPDDAAVQGDAPRRRTVPKHVVTPPPPPPPPPPSIDAGLDFYRPKKNP